MKQIKTKEIQKLPAMFAKFIAIKAGLVKKEKSETRSRVYRNPLTLEELGNLAAMEAGPEKKAYVKQLDEKYAEYRLSKLKSEIARLP